MQRTHRQFPHLRIKIFIGTKVRNPNNIIEEAVAGGGHTGERGQRERERERETVTVVVVWRWRWQCENEEERVKREEEEERNERRQKGLHLSFEP